MKPYYEDDLVTLYHGDCLEIDAWLQADVLITDPPYGMDYQSNWGDHKQIAGDADASLRDDAFSACGAQNEARLCSAHGESGYPRMFGN